MFTKVQSVQIRSQNQFRRTAALIAIVVAGAQIFGCVTPPQIEKSSVIDNSELELISNIKRGKDYALAGRMDLAEREFRQELVKYPNQSSIFADLGYVLIEQNRLDEAIVQLSLAVKLNPYNLPAHEHLARAYFRQDKYELAIIEYERLLNIIYLEIASKRISETQRGADVVRIYRDMAVVYHALGLYDEAICYSQLSRDIGGDSLQHIRLLLSLDRIGTAVGLLKAGVAVTGSETPAPTLLDYGIALVAAKDFNKGGQALDRALSAATGDAESRSFARLIKLKLAADAGDHNEEELIFQSLKDENPLLCEGGEINAPLYWPTDLVNDLVEVQKSIDRMCNE